MGVSLTEVWLFVHSQLSSWRGTSILNRLLDLEQHFHSVVLDGVDAIKILRHFREAVHVLFLKRRDAALNVHMSKSRGGRRKRSAVGMGMGMRYQMTYVLRWKDPV